MEIEFDPDKNAKNQAKHGLGFERVQECEWHHAIYHVQQGEFLEDRYKAVLPLDGMPHVVVFTYRHGVMRVLSFRPANRKERMRDA